ncbi:hypothetical protein ACFSR9_04695 [Deinococcus taklimakanensis]|uniref:Restriction endonuclease subunit S n=1 Tax=Deinococcus taklimakanensis TaxID=536443 RepID=A0ABW5P0U6_9DEIO
MIHDLKPYPAMKDSGVPWLGQVPEHWEVRSLGSLTKARSERNRPDLPLLSVVREKGVILRDRESKGENHNFIPDDLSNYKVVREGDLVVNKMKAWQGSMGLAPVDGIVSPAYFVFDFDIQNRKYGQALLRSSTYVGFFAQASDGVRIGQWDLSIDGMKRIPVVIPKPDEQAAIVRFLEHADRRIRKAIAAKQKLIKLLQEQKQVIIHQAVTRGLDPNVKLKPSGVEWLGDVPEGWEVKRAKYLFREIDRRSVAGDEEMLSVSHITGVTPRSEKNVTMFLSETNIGQKICQPGDVAINILWAWMGALGVSKHHGIVSPAYGIYRQRVESFVSEYLDNLLRDPMYVVEYGNRSKGVTASRARMYTDDFFNISFLRPPIDEQRAIGMHIAKETERSSVAASQAQQEISLLREYRTRLIADVVTGKLDVRDAAAQLPEPEQDTLTDEADMEVDADADTETELEPVEA